MVIKRTLWDQHWDINPTEFSMLLIFRTHQKERIGEYEDVLPFDKNYIYKKITDLEEKGYIKRKNIDGRRKKPVITKKGRKVLHVIKRNIEEALEGKQVKL